jgi:hypothetical protein
MFPYLLGYKMAFASIRHTAHCPQLYFSTLTLLSNISKALLDLFQAIPPADARNKPYLAICMGK